MLHVCFMVVFSSKQKREQSHLNSNRRCKNAWPVSPVLHKMRCQQIRSVAASYTGTDLHAADHPTWKYIYIFVESVGMQNDRTYREAHTGLGSVLHSQAC